MACGLGAIILVFMVIKHNVDQGVVEVDLDMPDMTELQLRQDSLQQEIRSVQESAAEIARQVEAKAKEVERYRSNLRNLAAESAEAARAKEALESAIESIEVQKPDDLVQTGPPQQEDYLIGLRVEGRKIAVLVDSSASMTDAVLIDVIRRKNGDSANKARGPKWLRTKRIVRWLLARLPRNARVATISFNDEARQLGAKDWTSTNDSAGIEAMLKDLDAVIPSQATNLHAALETAAKLKATDIYLITDGLPTAGDSGYKSLSPFAACSALWGGSTTISGECRVELFSHTVDVAELPGVKVNVVLLPLEGDPGASVGYWLWAARTGGLMISPADSWP